MSQMNSTPRGHSNVYPHELTRYDNLPDTAKIPLRGGSVVSAVKDLPPLALRRKEWEQIGQQMGWFPQLTISIDLSQDGVQISQETLDHVHEMMREGYTSGDIYQLNSNNETITGWWSATTVEVG